MDGYATAQSTKENGGDHIAPVSAPGGITWLDPPPDLAQALARGEVHVWRVSLNQDGAALAVLAELLLHDERLRASRFHFRRDKDRFIAARGALRNILSRTAGLTPESIHFLYNSYGKPSLAGQVAEGLRFSVSHSHDVALIAVAQGREVGIDIEFVREDINANEIAGRFFSPSEASALRALPAHAIAIAFFDCWVRKEAFIKARGLGLSLSLQSFSVSIAPAEPSWLLSEDESEVRRWSVVELPADEGYRAALALEGGVAELRFLAWEVGTPPAGESAREL
jgi:4'-phosphopantetheinyl transferase